MSSFSQQKRIAAVGAVCLLAHNVSALRIRMDGNDSNPDNNDGNDNNPDNQNPNENDLQQLQRLLEEDGQVDALQEINDLIRGANAGEVNQVLQDLQDQPQGPQEYRNNLDTESSVYSQGSDDNNQQIANVRRNAPHSLLDINSNEEEFRSVNSNGEELRSVNSGPLSQASQQRQENVEMGQEVASILTDLGESVQEELRAFQIRWENMSPEDRQRHEARIQQERDEMRRLLNEDDRQVNGADYVDDAETSKNIVLFSVLSFLK
jgi:hypothetical protein